MKTSTCILDDKGNIIFDTFEFAVAYNRSKRKAVEEYIESQMPCKQYAELKEQVSNDISRYVNKMVRKYSCEEWDIYKVINDEVFERAGFLKDDMYDL